jgi:hypothetical protein
LKQAFRINDGRLSAVALLIIFRVENALPPIKSGLTYQTTRRHITVRLTYNHCHEDPKTHILKSKAGRRSHSDIEMRESMAPRNPNLVNI